MRKTFCGLFAVLVAAPIVAEAGTVTYDFTGVVVGASGLYNSIAPGTSMTGTYTFNFANANPVFSSGVVGSSTSYWNASELGGSELSAFPLTSGYVFSQSESFGAYEYSTPSPGTYFSQSSVFFNASTSYEAYEEQIDSSGTGEYSYFTLNNGNLGNFNSAGLPIPFSFGNAIDPGAIGYINILSNGIVTSSVEYEMTSLNVAPVPLPAATWLLLSGIAGLGVMGRRRATHMNTPRLI